MKAVFVLALALFLGLVEGQGQDDCERIPDLPQSYQTQMQVNVLHELRGAEKGQTYLFYESVEGDKKAYMNYKAGTGKRLRAAKRALVLFNDLSCRNQSRRRKDSSRVSRRCYMESGN